MPRNAQASLISLRRRAEFLAVRGGARWTALGFVLEAKARVSAPDGAKTPRFGLTITKRLGNAVVRNRIRRRLREALRVGALTAAQPGFDYVMIARPAALIQPFDELVADVRRAFEKVHRRGRADR